MALRERCTLLRTIASSGAAAEVTQTYKTLIVAPVEVTAEDVYGDDVNYDTELVSLLVDARVLRPGSLPADVRSATYKGKTWRVVRTSFRNGASTGLILASTNI